jgi:hypothetical protein
VSLRALRKSRMVISSAMSFRGTLFDFSLSPFAQLAYFFVKILAHYFFPFFLDFFIFSIARWLSKRADAFLINPL